MSTFLEEKDVTPITLSLELEQAAIEHKLQDDQKIYVSESGMFPFWLQLYPQPMMLSFSTYFEFEKGMTESERYAFCNQFNSSSLLPGVHVHKDRVYADYAMTYRDGLIRNQFIRLCRSFAKGVDDARDMLATFSEGGLNDHDAQ